ncbi:ATP-binding protein [Sphingomonas daechungensis]|uniref:AAA family ATPase n=1 Tax=Sphingomonas daechungensis TaxID=1176646 RepID=UPI0031E99CC6
MLFEPTLLVRELAIYRGAQHAYRASFHKGVNIISGENSSGKSTILNLLAYGLGADISTWSEHAKLCDRVAVEVSLNGSIVTLSRAISEQSGQPMDIFIGDLAQSEQAPTAAWTRYPYRTSQSKESFSQAVFHLLNVPELETEASGKLTLHQILRLLYSDQLSPVEKIFREERFDTPALREAVGRLLFGAYDADIYLNQLRIRELEKELQSIDASLRTIYALLSGVEHSLTLNWLDEERRKVEAELEAVSVEIAKTEERAYLGEASSDLSLAPQERAFTEVQRLQAELSELEDREQALRLDFADSEVFITTLERKVQALQNSSTVAATISEVQYEWCPVCFAPLAAENNPHACRLCKEPFDEERLRKRMVSQISDMIVQVKQSKALQGDRSKALEEVAQRKSELRAKWDAAKSELTRVRRSPMSEDKDRLRALNERFGYLKRELEGVDEKAALIGRLDEMSRQKAELAANITELVDTNQRLKASEAQRLAKAYSEVATETVHFLHHDLPRQDSFQNAETVTFSFGEDKISVDGESYFSASSKVYLKNSFLAAFLFSAARDGQFRHLRFLILDTIEDKGMEPARSQNFQQLLVDRSSSIEADHQVIFATAMINPALDTDEFVVGRRSTHDTRTLLIAG